MPKNPSGRKTSDILNRSPINSGAGSLAAALVILSESGGSSDTDNVTNASNLNGGTGILTAVLNNISSDEVLNQSNLSGFSVTNALGQLVPIASGDIFVATGTGTMSRVPVGLEGQALIADMSTVTGLGWDDVPSGGGGGLPSGALVLIDETSFTGTQSTTSTSQQVGLELIVSIATAGTYRLAVSWGASSDATVSSILYVDGSFSNPAIVSIGSSYKVTFGLSYMRTIVSKTLTSTTHTIQIRYNRSGGTKAYLQNPKIAVYQVTP